MSLQKPQIQQWPKSFAQYGVSTRSDSVARSVVVMAPDPAAFLRIKPSAGLSLSHFPIVKRIGKKEKAY